MRKTYYLVVTLLAVMCNTNAQTKISTQKLKDSTTFKKEIKQLHQKISQADTVTIGNKSEMSKKNQTQSDPVRSKGTDKALNPQPFPPIDKNTGNTTQAIKSKKRQN